MSKTNEELNALKKEVENVNEKLHELTPEELEQVTGGITKTAFLRKVHMDFIVEGQEYGEPHITN